MTKAILFAVLVFLGPTPISQPNVCYGQLKPICDIGMQPVCLCSGDIGQDCKYICLPKGK